MFKSEVIGAIGKDAVIRTINNREYYEINVAHHRDKGSIWVRCHYRRTSDKLDNKLVKGRRCSCAATWKQVYSLTGTGVMTSLLTYGLPNCR